MKSNEKNGSKEMARKKDAPLAIGMDKAEYAIDDITENFEKGVDFAVVIKGKKPTLLVPGADKLAFAFNLMAQFSKDDEVLAMLANVKGLVALKCELFSRHDGKKVGEGRGAAVLGDGGNCKDPNSTVKMAEIRAKRDAVLNVFPIRDRFTQDVEDQKDEEKKLAVDKDGNISL